MVLKLGPRPKIILTKNHKNMESSKVPDANAAQDEEIASEMNIQAPTGSLESLTVLQKEYTNNPAFLPKITELVSKYSTFRRSRGDGNCFYRSVAFQVLDYLRQSTMDVVEAALIKHTEALDGLCNFFSYERFTCEDFYETFCEGARDIQGKSLDKVSYYPYTLCLIILCISF